MSDIAKLPASAPQRRAPYAPAAPIAGAVVPLQPERAEGLPVRADRSADRPVERVADRPVERLADRVVERPVVREGGRRSQERSVIDYRQPSHIERAQTLKAAWERSGADENQRLLLRELMAYYRGWCLRQGLGDPFVEPAR